MVSKELQAAVDLAWAGVMQRDITWDDRRAFLADLMVLRGEHTDCPLPTDYAYDDTVLGGQLGDFAQTWPYGDFKPGETSPSFDGARFEQVFIGVYGSEFWAMRIYADSSIQSHFVRCAATARRAAEGPLPWVACNEEDLPMEVVEMGVNLKDRPFVRRGQSMAPADHSTQRRADDGISPPPYAAPRVSSEPDIAQEKAEEAARDRQEEIEAMRAGED